MAKPIVKTKKTTDSVAAFIKTVDPSRQADCKTIIKMMKKSTGSKPAMWGTSIIGFGEAPIKYASGRELNWPILGFSPRKREFSLYVLCADKKMAQLLKKLGPHKTGKACLYIKSLEDIDVDVLQQICTLASTSGESGCG